MDNGQFPQLHSTITEQGITIKYKEVHCLYIEGFYLDTCYLILTTNDLTRRYKLFLLLIFCVTLTRAQDSSKLRISLLTCTPGEELYSTFGHSAIRIVDEVDSIHVTDIVYNYGTFNFDDDGFYIKFARGKLLYYLSLERFDDFKELYQSTNRGMTEQVFNLTGKEKISIQHFLNENAKEENRYYRYDFFFDNCTTRLRDILKRNHDSSFCRIAVMPAGTSFREALHVYLDKNRQPWSKLGIDILLGAPSDATMTAEQMQFLPDNLMKSLDSSRTMVHTSQNLYPIENKTGGWQFTPMICFTALLVFMILLSFSASNFLKGLLQGLDGLLFFLSGALGVIMILMWTATDHAMCRNNLNLLWALPTHAVMAFFISSSKRWARYYFIFTGIAMALLLLAWFFLPQQMNNALLPVVLLLMYRAFRLGMK